MQREAKITSKGQITVPLDVRRLLGVKTGDKLLFESSNKEILVRAVREVVKENPFAKYAGIGNPGIPKGKKAILKYISEMRGR